MSLGLGYPIVANAAASERVAFIRRTYIHLAGAILAFVALEYVLLQLESVQSLALGMINSGGLWLLILGGFAIIGWLARVWAQNYRSPAMQYLGLGLYVVAEAVIFLPLLYVAQRISVNIIPQAGIMTLSIFAGLTVAALVTRQDFSFLGPILSILGFVSLGFIVAFCIFGISEMMSLIFCYAMIAIACGAILYSTSNVLHHYHTDQHVAAALELFASIALLFWYILQLVMSTSNRD